MLIAESVNHITQHLSFICLNSIAVAKVHVLSYKYIDIKSDQSEQCLSFTFLTTKYELHVLYNIDRYVLVPFLLYHNKTFYRPAHMVYKFCGQDIAWI